MNSLYDLVNDTGTIIIPSGTYELDRPLEINNGTKLIMSKDVLLRAHFSGNEPVIAIHDVDDVEIYGGGARIVIDDEVLKDRKEHNHGVAIRDSIGVTVSDLNVSDVGGDGVYVGPISAKSAGSHSVNVSRVAAFRPLRCGVSIVACSMFRVTEISTYGKGMSYGNCGVRVEPSDFEDAISDGLIANCRTYGRAHGIHLQLKKAGIFEVEVVNCSARVAGSAWRITSDKNAAASGAIRVVNCPGEYEVSKYASTNRMSLSRF